MARHGFAKAFPGAAENVRLPRIERRVQGPGQPVHPIDVTEKLFIGHDGKGDFSRCRTATPIKLSPALLEAALVQAVAPHPLVEGAPGNPQCLPGCIDLALAFPEG
jgi:hypothetical protein